MAVAGLKIVLPGSFTDISLPVLRDDTILSSGSLVLMDVAHSTIPSSGFLLPSGVLSDGIVLFNSAYKEAAAILGSGTAASLAGSFALKGGGNNGVKGKFERTPLGGIHGIISQANALASGDGAYTNIAAAIRTYIAANPTHSYYLSQWDRLTRANGGSNAGAISVDTSGGSSFANQLLYMRGDNGWASSNSGTIPLAGSKNSPAVNTVGNRLSTAALAANSGTGFTAGQSYFGPSWGAVGTTAALLSTRNNYFPSFAFYRLYLEDLTVSGRSYATVDALDSSLWQAAFAAGGRFYGDTLPTAVTAVP